MTTETLALDSDGGRAFDTEAVSEIGGRSGNRIDALFLKGNRRSGQGGRERERFSLLNDEHINYISVGMAV